MRILRRSLYLLMLALGLLLLSFFAFLPGGSGRALGEGASLLQPLEERIALREKALEYRITGESEEARGNLPEALGAYRQSYALYEDPLLREKIRALEERGENLHQASVTARTAPDLEALRQRIAYLESLVGVGAPEHSRLQLKEAQEITRQQISPEGGVLKVDLPGDPLDGLEIKVPSGAWKIPVELVLQRREIAEHDFGPLFNPVSPLLQVQNPGLLAEEPLEISIPVTIPEGYFGMAFYCDPRSGRLEGLMPLASEKDRVVAATRRFSDIVVSVVSMDAVTGDLNIDTGFRPGYDDWQVPNRGSWIAPRGHCAGQSVAAMWYFYERRLGGERPLYGRYDNNNRGYGTLDFWQDDSWGYRLSSVIQRELNWDSQIYQTLRELRGANDPVTMMAFAYIMQLTGGPQYVGITSDNPPAGHAIIAYRMERDRIYVSDPNHHGQERYIAYENGRFLPYNSGLNAQAIAEGNEVAFTRIGYLPLSRWMDWEGIGRRWQEVFAGEGRVGEDFFPPVTVEVLVSDGTNFSWIPLVDRYATDEDTTRRATYTDNGFRYNMTGRLGVRVNPTYTSMRITAFRQTATIFSVSADQTVPFRLQLQEGENDFGFLMEFPVDGRFKFYDFQRFIVRYNEREPEPPEERFFFENRTFWMTGSPFANDSSVTFPKVPLNLGLEVTGLSGDILPNTPEAERLGKMTEGVANAKDAMKEQILLEMQKMGVTLTEAQLQEVLAQTLGLSGFEQGEGGGQTAPGTKILASGYAAEGEPLTLTLSVALDAIPPVPVAMPETPPLEGQVRVTKWLVTTGFRTSPEMGGSSGSASISWTPGKDTKDANIPESFSVDLLMYYSLDFYKRGTQEPWLDSGVPVRYDNLSVSFPVGICFFPVVAGSQD